LGIALDSGGNMYLAGMTSSADFPTRNAFQPQFGGGTSNGFVTKLRGDGSAIVYSTYVGGADGLSQLNGIFVDASGSAYVAGQGGSDFPIVNGLQAYGGGWDAVIAHLTPDGSALLFSTFVGGSGLDLASGIALDPSGRIVVTGQTSSPNLPVTPGAFQTLSTVLPDAFVTRIAVSPTDAAIFSSPKLIPIGQAYVGQWSAPQSIQITNPGTQALRISSFAATSNLKLTNTCSTLAPGVSCSLSASLLASALGSQSGTITVFDNAPDSPQTIFVTATGTTGGDLALISLTTGASFNYYGRTAIPLTATITNNGPNDSSNVMLSIASNGGTGSCNPCYVGAIKAGTSAIFRFNLIPSIYGMIPLTVQVQPSSITPDLTPANNVLTVLVANPRYAVSPAQLTFSTQTVNLPSATQSITFTALDQNLLQLSFSATGDFSVTSACDPGSLRCYACLSFLPTAAGTRSGTLIVTEAMAGTTQVIPLAGTGVLAPDLKLSDTQLSFVAGVTGGPTGTRQVTITNDGSALLFLVSISVTGSFIQTNQCPPSLLPGNSCQVAVSFVASNPGTSTGTLTIADNAASRMAVIPLTGTGIPLLTLSRPSRPSSGTSAPVSQGSTGAAPAPASSGNSSTRPARPAATSNLRQLTVRVLASWAQISRSR